MTLRFLPLTPNSLLVELSDLDATLALFDALTHAALPGIAELVPAARTLLVRTHPGTPANGTLAAAIAAQMPQVSLRSETAAEVLELPVTYDGADLSEVAALMSLTTAEVIAAHQAALWTVAFCGFAPGFAYMTGSDPRFDLPRRASPRPRIPAGSVALAGRFCGIYPQASPGGWQLIGTTPEPMWDLSRNPPALLRPGQRVRFVARTPTPRKPPPQPSAAPTGPSLHIRATAFPVLVQDAGRPHQAALGLTASGALDLPALRRANRALGNPPDSPALELTLGPTRISVDQPATLALDGAATQAAILTPTARIAIDPARPFALDPGEVLEILPPTRGMRSYLALRGGFAVAPTLGSASTDTLAHLGPPPLTTGSALPLGHAKALAVDPTPRPAPHLPAPGETVTLPVTLGPRADWFPPEMLALFLSQEWEVTPHCSRTGLRLSGAAPLTRDARELPSEGTERGAIQIPHSGQPVLFLADHPLTGGYPVIATLLPEALPLAAQLPPGARIRFAAATPFAPIEPTP
ncbi:sensor histidine kinase inhibitor, KipI family [Gemmobacter aquatilis]|uniref:Sensor histidine kinase inhibitor, KipI family n=1 Tax=Gemmobacter aquatilis TaxID=933059 RepID=A0A1H7Y987_9RHOB|nr:urea amidolyase family protein [Gemmobacter aquatilis]SEM42786.1 sensor histidine kinase inhibitor, KipI family [Gemmobacter aquatilis]